MYRFPFESIASVSPSDIFIVRFPPFISIVGISFDFFPAFIPSSCEFIFIVPSFIFTNVPSIPSCAFTIISPLFISTSSSACNPSSSLVTIIFPLFIVIFLFECIPSSFEFMSIVPSFIVRLFSACIPFSFEFILIFAFSIVMFPFDSSSSLFAFIASPPLVILISPDIVTESFPIIPFVFELIVILLFIIKSSLHFIPFS